MLWCVLWAVLAGAGVLGTWVSVNNLRFARGFERDVQALLAATQLVPLDRENLERLPAPVRTYMRRALGDAPRALQSVRFRHGGSFRPRLDGPWQTIRGQQYDTAQPPGFLWWGRIAMAPGLWIDARDRGIDGKGGMLVELDASVTLFDRTGRELDQGAMLRLLSELVLLPSALFDDRYVAWEPVDERHALATLRAPGGDVSGSFEFGEDGLPVAFSAERYMDTGAGEAKLLPWSGEYGDYRSVSGILVPHHFVGYWHVDGVRIAYVDFLLDTPEFDVHEPFQ